MTLEIVEQVWRAKQKRQLIFTSHNANLAVMHGGQGGCGIILVEIKRSSLPLYTKALSEAKGLRIAQKQVSGRHAWIMKNQTTFLNGMVDLAVQLPLFPRRHRNGSFALGDAERVRQF